MAIASLDHTPRSLFLFALAGMIGLPLLAQTTDSTSLPFSDVTATVGIDTANAFSWGSSWGDANSDGFPDLFLSNHFRIKDENAPVIYYSQGDGTFLADSVPGFLNAKDMHGAGWFDADNDGDQDLLVTTGRAGRNLFLVNDNMGGFSDQAVSLGLDVPNARGRTPLFLDFDRDGLLDVITTAGPPLSATQLPTTMSLASDTCGDLCYSNLQAPESGILGTLSSTEALLFDWNLDGQLEPIVVTPNNQPFFPMACLPLIPGSGTTVMNTNEVLSGDFNGDGLQDLYFIRNNESQSGVTTRYPINYPFFFGIGLLDTTQVDVDSSSTEARVAMLPGAVLSYTPDSAFTGLDSVLIGICDSSGFCTNRTLIFDVRDTAFVPEFGRLDAVSGNTRLLDIPSWVHPYRAHMRAGLQPRSTAHLIRFKSPSDTILVGTAKLNLDSNEVFIGAQGSHPDKASRFVLRASDTSTHGNIPVVPGAHLQLIAGYDTATTEWLIGLNSDRPGDLMVLSVFSSSECTVTEYIGFDSLPIETPDKLLLGNAEGLVDGTAMAGLSNGNRAIAGVALDYDNDMDLDIYLSNGISGRNDPNALLENLGNGVFAEVPFAGGASGKTIGSAGPVTKSDYDRDGFLDLFVEHGRDPANEKKGPYQLFRNNGNGNHWLGIELIGSSSNRDGIGATVYLYAGGVVQVRYADGGMHRYCQDDKALHFGLGSHTSVDSLVIVWPSGSVQRPSIASVDQYLSMVEPDSGRLTCFAPGILKDSLLLADRVQLLWEAVPCASGYLYSYRKSDSLVWITDTASASTTTASVSDLEPGQAYEWRIRPMCQDGSLGSFSRVKLFNTPEACVPPDSLSTTFSASRFTLAWNAVPGALGYALNYRRDVDSVFNRRIVLDTMLRAPLAVLDSGTVYSWFVQPSCALLPLGDSSSIQNFSIPGLRQSAFGGIQLSAFPNPADRSLKLSYPDFWSQAEAWQLLWHAIDATGRLVDQGQTTLPGRIDPSAWPDGWYGLIWRAHKSGPDGRSLRGQQRILIQH